MRFDDVREKLPRHEHKFFPKRRVAELRGLVVHQTAGGDDVYKCARYHTGPNHVCLDGCPGILYTFFIDMAGTIYWCNDLDCATYSQGGRGTPIPGTRGNKHFLSVVCGGDFDGSTSYKGDDGHPTAAQVHALMCLVMHLTGEHLTQEISEELFGALPFSSKDIYSHADFGKPACPGRTLNALTDAFRSHLHKPKEWSVADWQKELAKAGYLDEDGVDGAWGPLSRKALIKMQKDTGLEADGIRGPLSRAALEGLNG